MIYDVIVIGGGPAGMMAAGLAGQRGARVLLLEKNERLGVKLLATGHGRCNLTNMRADDKSAIGVYGPYAKFLFSAFHRFGVSDTLRFFADLRLETKAEDRGRVFPRSDRASEVLETLVGYLEANSVIVRLGAEVKELATKGGKIRAVTLAGGEEISAKSFIVCSGGKSYPLTGSSGDGYRWLSQLGHTVNTPRPALAALIVADQIVQELEGLSLEDIGISVYREGKRVLEERGDIVFSADGLSGPAAIDLSGRIGALLPADLELQIDLRPEIELEPLEKLLQDDFHHSNNKIYKNYLSTALPPKMVPVIIGLSRIDAQKKVNTITKEERQRLVRLLKGLPLAVKGLKGFDRAMVTAGGADLKEIDPRTMRSRRYNNLYLAGEILDLDGPSGGYNLQICWSTGYLAGDCVEF